ncbi:MAG: threonylcarbamoyl-AMP synthase [Nitrospinae bacterium]|nr:threonylcarbamoyl-AMP synthase [Nitrospinota bacterium]
MKTLHMRPDRPDYSSLKEAADMVLAGGTIIYPTDTIYGLGCDVYSKTAIEKLARIKEREPGKPFSFICENVAQISEFAFVSNWAYRLMNRLLPGPYTFILEARKTGLPKKITSKRNTVGVRIPGNAICSKLVGLVGRPIVTTSVNFSGDEPITDPADLPVNFSSAVDLALSVGPLSSEPSTVLDLTRAEPQLIRQGKGEAIW